MAVGHGFRGGTRRRTVRRRRMSAELQLLERHLRDVRRFLRAGQRGELGIIAAGCGVAFYAVLWVGLLVCIKKESKFNVLTRSWASFLLFFAIEIIALAVVLFGGLLNVV